jgi:hypothetical protein
VPLAGQGWADASPGQGERPVTGGSRKCGLERVRWGAGLLAHAGPARPQDFRPHGHQPRERRALPRESERAANR